MEDMFKNYRYIPSDYIPNNIQDPKLVHPVIKLPLEEYNAKGEFIGYSWRQGDTILLQFTTEGEVLFHNPDIAEDAETYFEGKKFLIEIMNFKYEVIYQEEVIADADLHYYLPPDLIKILIPNTYSLQVTVIDEENDVRHTLLDRRDIRIFVR